MVLILHSSQYSLSFILPQYSLSFILAQFSLSFILAQYFLSFILHQYYWFVIFSFIPYPFFSIVNAILSLAFYPPFNVDYLLISLIPWFQIHILILKPWSLFLDSWCLILIPWSLILDSWCLISDSWPLTPDFWSFILDSSFLIFYFRGV